MNTEPVSGTVVRMTDRAVLFHLDEQDRDLWIPLSMIDEDAEDLDVGVVQEINVAQWFYDREIEQ